MLIGSLDIGIRNIGFCVYDTETDSVKHVEIIDLLYMPNTKKRLPFGDQSVVFLVRRAIEKRQALFDQCDVVGIEKQMTRRMVLIQLAFECLLDHQCIVLQISPRSVKTMFGTSRGVHKKNKEAAILQLYAILDDTGKEKISQYRKKDDIADAILQAMYIGANVDALCDKKIKACAIPSKKKRKRKTSKRRGKKPKFFT